MRRGWEGPNGSCATGVDDGGAIGDSKMLKASTNAQERAQTVDAPAAFETRSRLFGE
jgi:hypothetical protein